MFNPKSYCLGLLKRRLRSAWELEQAMQTKEVEPAVRESVLAELRAVGLVDDHRFALAWVHTRDSISPRGKYMLRRELLEKGIDEALIQEVLKERQEEVEESEGPDELALAKRLVESRQRLYANLSPVTRERRLSAFLQRRGFSYDVIRRILNA